jgi:hypothetical protein
MLRHLFDDGVHDALAESGKLVPNALVQFIVDRGTSSRRTP